MTAVPPPNPDEIAAGSWRLLRWLERYPFQRARDVMVALAPWEKRSTLYEHVADLERRRLIASLRWGGSKSVLYYLSPRGRAACALWAAQQEERPSFHEEREHLLRLLPRLPVLLKVQDLVNGLVMGAASALAQQGRQAQMVQWNWQRDYTQRFRARGEQDMTLRTDGALAFRVRFSAGTQLLSDEWYSLLVLYCPLDDLRVLRQRLNRLLRWRKSAERWSTSGQMPTVAILATTPRQAEWWSLAAAQVARKLHTEILDGAITVLPTREIENGWRLGWRRLDTAASCHLQELLQAAAPPLLPELASATPGSSTRRAQPQAKQMWPLPPAGGKRAYLPRVISSAQQTPADYRLSSLRLTPRQWELLLLCFAHPLLSPEDLVAFCGLGLKTVQGLLRALHEMEYVMVTETATGPRYQLAEQGLRLLASFAACSLQRFLHLPLPENAPLQQRGVKGLLHQMHHTAGIYGFFASLASTLVGVPDAHLRWWETGARCERVFTWRNQVYHFKPDACAGVQLARKPLLRFWLEYDRGTMMARDLESKCATYAAFLASREWAFGSAIPPVLLAVVPEIAQEQRFSRTAQALLAHITGLRFYTTTIGMIVTAGLSAPIWQPQLPQRAPPARAERVALFGPEAEAAGERRNTLPGTPKMRGHVPPK